MAFLWAGRAETGPNHSSFERSDGALWYHCLLWTALAQLWVSSYLGAGTSLHKSRRDRIWVFKRPQCQNWFWERERLLSCLCTRRNVPLCKHSNLFLGNWLFCCEMLDKSEFGNPWTRISKHSQQWWIMAGCILKYKYQGSKIEHTLIFSFGKPLPHYNDSEPKQIEQIRDTEEAGEEASR